MGRARDIVPAVLNRAQAAAYVGLAPNTFDKEVEANRFPSPIPLTCRRRLWSKAALDRALEGRRGVDAGAQLGTPDPGHDTWADFQ